MNKRKLKRYKVSPDNSLCFAVSVVDKPATESDFLYFNKEQEIEKFVGIEGERRMIYGCAMRADYPIYRNNKERGEYYLEFDKEAIDKLSKNYFKMQFQNQWTEAHQDEVEGLTITESWIKEDMYKDKSIALGLDPNIAVGSWFIGCYCENDDIWQKVKQGTYHGFSCEALISLEELFETQITNNDNDNDMNEEMLFSKIKNLIKDFFKGNNEEVDTEDSEAQKVTHLEEQTPTEEPQNEPTPEPQEPPKVEEPIETKEEVKEEPTEPQNEPKQEEDNHINELVNNLKAEIEALKELNKDLTNKVKDLGRQPSVKPANVGGATKKGDAYDNWRNIVRSFAN